MQSRIRVESSLMTTHRRLNVFSTMEINQPQTAVTNLSVTMVKHLMVETPLSTRAHPLSTHLIGNYFKLFSFIKSRSKTTSPYFVHFFHSSSSSLQIITQSLKSPRVTSKIQPRPFKSNFFLHFHLMND